MSTESDNTEFERRARELLRESADSLDAASRSRLTQARHAALAQRHAGPRWLNLRLLAPGGAVAAAALLAVLLWTGPGHPPVNESTGGALDDLELLADSDGYELSQEPDLEFIEWAAAMGEKGSLGT